MDGHLVLIGGKRAGDLFRQDFLAIEPNLDSVVAAQEQRERLRRINLDSAKEIIRGIVAGKVAMKLAILPRRLGNPFQFAVLVASG